MAKELQTLETLLKGAAPQFKPGAFYSKDGDCLHIFISGDDATAHRVDSVLTVYETHEDKELTGVMIKGVRRLLEKCGHGGSLGVALSPGSKVTGNAAWVMLCYLYENPSRINAISGQHAQRLSRLLEVGKESELELV